MNKGLRILGFIGAVMMFLAGVFKMEHFPGGGVLLVFGSFFILAFLISWFVFIVLKVDDKKEKYAYIFLYFVLMFACLANVFVIQHYPFAKPFIFLELIIFVFVFIPLYLIYLKSVTDVIKKTYGFSFLIFLITVLGLLLIKGTSSVGVINSIAVLDTNINKSTKNIEAVNKGIYESLANSTNADRAEKIWVLSEQLFKYIANLKSELISKTEEIDIKTADTISMMKIKAKDNFDIPTYYFIGDSEDGSKGKSRELKNKINDYKAAITEVINPEKKEEFIKTLGLSVEDPNYKIDGEKMNWEMYTFYHMILITDLGILSQMQSDVRYAESVALNNLLQKK